MEYNNNDCTIDYAISDGLNFISNSNGELLFISPELCKMLGYNSTTDIVYESFHELLEENSNYSKRTANEIADKIEAGRKVVDFVVKFRGEEKLILFSLFPVLDFKHNIGKIYAFGRYLNLPSYMEIFLKNYKFMAKANLENDLNVQLNSREQMIIFLLIAGFTQEEVGKILGFSRGHIGKLIAKEICPKFNLAGSSTKGLVRLSIYHNVLKDTIPHDIADNMRVFYLTT